MKKLVFSVVYVALLAACVPQKPLDAYNYTAYRAANPKSILILPALNNSPNVNAPDYYLSTVSKPVSERGYYVFPVNMVKSMLEQDGLGDPALLYEAETPRLDRLFDCDAVLYLAINRWDSQYYVLGTTTNVAFSYEIRSCDTGDVLWARESSLSYTPNASASGNPIADVIAMAVVAAIEKGDPNYMPLARQVNAIAVSEAGKGLPAGPYLPEKYRKDFKEFPN